MSKNSSKDNLDTQQGSASNSKGEKKEQDGKLEKNLTKHIAKGGGITLFGRFGGKLLKFLFQILLTRVLGAGSYGLYALGDNVLRISKTVSQLGLQNGVLRFGSIYWGEKDNPKLKGTIIISLFSSFIAGLLVALCLFLFADFLSNIVFNEPELKGVIRKFSFSLPFYTLMVVTAFATRIFRKMKYDVSVRLVLHPFLVITFSGLSFVLGLQLEGVIYGFLISSIISAIIGIYLLANLFPYLVSGLRPQFEVRKLLYFSVTVMLVGFSSILIFRMDRIMVGIFGVAEDVGIYNAAAIMAGQTVIFLGSFNAVFAPIISDLYNRDKISQLNNLFKTTTKWIFSLTLPLFLIFLLYSRQIMGIYGPKFKVGGTVLIVLGVAQLLNATVGSSGYILTMTGYQKLELINNLTLGVLNISLNIFLIPRLGILGAALATGFSIALVNIARLIEVYWIHSIHPYKWSYWKPALAGITASLIILTVNNTIIWPRRLWLLGVIVFILLYIIIFIMEGFDREDKLILETLLRKFI